MAPMARPASRFLEESCQIIRINQFRSQLTCRTRPQSGCWLLTSLSSPHCSRSGWRTLRSQWTWRLRGSSRQSRESYYINHDDFAAGWVRLSPPVCSPGCILFHRWHIPVWGRSWWSCRWPGWSYPRSQSQYWGRCCSVWGQLWQRKDSCRDLHV